MRRTLQTIIAVSVGILWLVSLLAIAGRFVVAVELYSHFQPPLMVATALLAVAALAVRQWKVAIPSAVLAMILGWSTAPYLLAPPALPQQAGPQPIRLLWSNLRNWSTSGDALEVVLEDGRADVVMLTELSARHVRAANRARSRWPYQTPFPTGSAFDLLMLSRWEPRDLRVHRPFGERFPIFDALICPDGFEGWNDSCLAVVALHSVRPALPGGFVGVAPLQRDATLAAAAAAVRRRLAEKHRAVLMGDFNTTPWSASFRRTLRESGLLDSATQPAERPGRPRPTWLSRWPVVGLPIDHILISPDWRVGERRLGPFFGSDHWPLVIELSPIGRSG